MVSMGISELSDDFLVAGTSVRTSALILRPPEARVGFVLAHGAGAGMRHAFLDTLAQALAAASFATFRYQFPYMEQGRRAPDPPHLLQATVRSAVQTAQRHFAGLPLVAGGKSLGGRMTSNAVADAPLAGVHGLIFVGFPLHAAGRPGDGRAAHLESVGVPMLFLQGTRDALARLDLIERVCRRLGNRATLHVVEGGDHSFKVLKRSGRTEEEVVDELVEAMGRWASTALGLPSA